MHASCGYEQAPFLQLLYPRMMCGVRRLARPRRLGGLPTRRGGAVPFLAQPPLRLRRRVAGGALSVVRPLMQRRQLGGQRGVRRPQVLYEYGLEKVANCVLSAH